MTTLKREGWQHVVRTLRDHPGERHVYLALETDALPILEALDYSQWKGYPTSILHFIGRGAAYALASLPDSGGRERKGVDVFFVSRQSRDAHVTGSRVANVDRKTVLDVSSELELHKKRSLGTPSGCAVVSHVTPRGVPLSWLLNVPLWFVFSEEVERVVVLANTSTFGYMLPITLIAERAYFDGGYLQDAIVAFQDYLTNPASFERGVEGISIGNAVSQAQRG